MPISAARLMVEVGADTSDAEKGVGSFSKKLNSTAKNMAVIGAGLTGAITLPLLGIAKAGLDSAMDFEQNMNILQQVIGATADDMSGMQAEALRLGQVTSFSAGEAAEAMLELGKAGMSTEEIMASIGGVMDLAAAGGVSLAEAANLTASTLNAFGLEASESTRIANIFAATANASAADISDLGQGMQQAGFAFANANQPVENLAASLAILTNVGLTGADAGTALKNAFLRMMNPTQEAIGVMNELGISFYDATGTMKQLPDIIDMLNVATAGLTDEQRDAALSTILMSDGMKAMLPLMDQGSDGFLKMVDSVTQAGAATDVANARMKGLSGGIEYLKGSVDSFLIGAALPFLDTLGGLTRLAGDALTAFGELPQPVINATLAFLGILAAAGPLMLAIGGLTAAFAFLISPIGLVIAGVAALAAAWAADLGGIQGITADVFAGVQTWFTSTLAAAQELGSGIQAAFANTSFPSLETLWSQFKAGEFEQMASTIRDTAYELMVNLDAELNITGKANELKAQLVGVINAMSTAIQGLDFSGVGAQFDGVRDGILNGLSTAIDSVDWGGGGNTFTSLVDGLTEAVNGLDFSSIDWAGVLQTALVSPIGAAVAALDWVFGSDSFANLKTSVESAIGEVSWGEMAISLGGLVSAVGKEIGAVFADIGADLGLKIPEIKMPDIDWEQLTINTVGLVSSLSDKIAAIDWGGVGQNIGTALIGAAKLGIGALVTGISALSSMGELTTSVTAAMTALAFNIGAEAGAALGKVDLVSALSTLQTNMQTAFAEMVGGIMTSFTAEWKAITIPTPAWITALINWKPTTPQWITDLQQWGRESMAAIAAFDWADWIDKLLWPVATIAGFLWSTFVTALTWPVATIDAFSWDTWLDALTWPLATINAFNWDTWLDALTWPLDAINGFSWGDWIDSLEWPSKLFDFSWSDFVSPFSAPDSPGLDSGGSIAPRSSGVPIQGLPNDSRSRGFAMAAGGNGSPVVQFTGAITINNDMDIERLTLEIARRLQQKMR